MRLIVAAAMLLTLELCSAPSRAGDGDLYAPSVWDLTLGKHAFELPEDQFIDYACGTNGGPPARPIKGWADFAQCRPEPATGLHEVYFRYDDEPEYWARARDLATQIALYAGTTAYELPVIVSGLFDDDGFLIAIRVLSDPRAEANIRENAYTLGVYLFARYGDGWDCEDQPKTQGRTEIRGVYFDRFCKKLESTGNSQVTLELRHFRKSGQTAMDPLTGMQTAGQLESSARLEVTLTGGIADRGQRLAALRSPGQSEREKLIARARDCRGCDLRGANLKRANLRGADLAGADLSGANLHGADLSEANLAGANLSKANLNRIDLHSADLREADASETMLYGAKLNGTNLTHANLNETRARKAQFTRAIMTGAQLAYADLRETRLGEANLSRANLSGSWLHDAQFGRAKLENAVLEGTVMWNANMADADLRGVQIRSSDLFGVDLRRANLTAADFSNSRLSRANMTDTIMIGTVFDGAIMPDAQ